MTLFSSLSRVPATSIWSNGSLPAHFPRDLSEALQRTLASFSAEGLPCAISLDAFEIPHAIRPKSHQRAFYIDLKSEFPGCTGYLAIKGSEPNLSAELAEVGSSPLALSWVSNRGMTYMDLFPIAEHKVPLMLSTSEALHEAQIGQTVHSAYMKAFDEIPLLPLPLGVYRWPDEVTAKARDALLPTMGSLAQEIVQRLLSGGSAALVYYYPIKPFPRVRSIVAAAAGFRSNRMERLGENLDPTTAIGHWVRLFTRLLSLGYLPASPCRSATGQAIQAQNAVLGGGFVDLDSLVPIDTLPDERAVLESYMLSVTRMANTIACLLFSNVNEAPGVQGNEMASYLFFYDLFSTCVAEEQRAGRSFPSRLKALPPFARTATDWIALAASFEKMPQTYYFNSMLRDKK